MQVVNFIINQVFREPAFFLGVVVLLGMIFMKRTGKEILFSTIKTIVGVRSSSGRRWTAYSCFQPDHEHAGAIASVCKVALVTRGGRRRSYAAPRSGLVGNIGLVMVGAWLLHLVFSSFTPPQGRLSDRACSLHRYSCCAVWCVCCHQVD